MVHPSADFGERAARFLYRWRFAFAVAALLAVGVCAGLGARQVTSFSEDVAALADSGDGREGAKLLLLDPTLDIWFGERDEAVETFYQIEDSFIPEDFVLVAFEVKDREFGVFDREALATIARLTEELLKVPGVRHVRSLTSNPWIRWGDIEDEFGNEQGLIISDLFEGDPSSMSEDQVLERMIAVLGARRVAQKVGEARVRDILDGRSFDDALGEPPLVGTLVNAEATTTAIQLQVLRPRIEADELQAIFADSEEHKRASRLAAIQRQRAALRGIEQVLRVELGLAHPTPESNELRAWIQSLPDDPQRHALQREFEDPTRNFMRDRDGRVVRKSFAYDRVGDTYVDRTDPQNHIEAPEDFVPTPKSPFLYHLAGVSLFERNFERVGMADSRFLPIMFLVMAVSLLVVFRRLFGALAPLVVVFGSVLAMIGIVFAFGGLLNNLTVMSPNLLAAIGIADAIHLIAAWRLLHGRFEDRASLIQEVVRRNALPVLLTSLTTAIGFLSLTTSSLDPVKSLGWMAALGTLFAWAFSMAVIPSLLSLLPHTKKQTGPSRFERFFSVERTTTYVDALLKRRLWVLGITLVLLIVAVAGLGRLSIDSDFRAMFPEENPTIQQFRWIEERLCGVAMVEIVFEGQIEGASELSPEAEATLASLEQRELGAALYPEEFETLSPDELTSLESLRSQRDAWRRARIGVDPDFLSALDRFESHITTEMMDPSSPLAVVTDILSPLDVLRKIHQVQNESKASFYRVPDRGDLGADVSRDELLYDDILEEWTHIPAQTASSLIAQYYLQYDSGARPAESLSVRLSGDRTLFRMECRMTQSSSANHLRAFARLEEIAAQEFPELAHSIALREGLPPSAQPKAEMVVSGKALLLARTSNLIAHEFLKSMGLALLVITVLMGVIFRSLRFALLSLIPNVLPIVLPLSAFGLLGIPLDGPSIFVSSVALGVCVDDSIHFFTKFDRARRKGLPPRESLIQALSEVGAALTVTTLVLILGFGTLLLSDFAPNFQMGALASIMIAFAWLADFVVTAAALSFERATGHRPLVR